jgi:hypothetical protein
MDEIDDTMKIEPYEWNASHEWKWVTWMKLDKSGNLRYGWNPPNKWKWQIG